MTAPELKPWEFSHPYTATFRDGLDGKWLSLKAHEILIASFSVLTWGSEQACIEAAWLHAYGDQANSATERLCTKTELQADIAAAMMGAAIAAGNKIVEIARAANPDQSPLKLQILRVDMEKAVKASIPTDATTALQAMLAEAEKRGRDGALENTLDRIRKLRGEEPESGPTTHPYDNGYLAALDAMSRTIHATNGGE